MCTASSVNWVRRFAVAHFIQLCLELGPDGHFPIYAPQAVWLWYISLLLICVYDKHTALMCLPNGQYLHHSTSCNVQLERLVLESPMRCFSATQCKLAKTCALLELRQLFQMGSLTRPMFWLLSRLLVAYMWRNNKNGYQK